MGYGRKVKTEHAGAKNGCGYWGKRETGKMVSRKNRRRNGRKMIKSELRAAS